MPSAREGSAATTQVLAADVLLAVLPTQALRSLTCLLVSAGSSGSSGGFRLKTAKVLAALRAEHDDGHPPLKVTEVIKLSFRVQRSAGTVRDGWEVVQEVRERNVAQAIGERFDKIDD